MKGLFHKEIGFPVQLPKFISISNLEYSKHAKLAALTDRYGKINLPENLNTASSNVFELELDLETGAITKIAVRVPYNALYDLTLVIRNYSVSTVWLNDKNDKHTTLDKSKYIHGCY